MQECRPGNLPPISASEYNQEFQRIIDANFDQKPTNTSDTDKKFKDLVYQNFSPEDQLFYSLILNQNPLQAVGSVAIGAIRLLESEPDNLITPESTIDAQQVDFWLWEHELAGSFPESPNNGELSAIGSKLDTIRGKIINDQTAEQWYDFKRQVAELKSLPESKDKAEFATNLNNLVDKFILNL